MASTKKAAAMPQTISKTVALQDLRAGDAVNARRTGRDTSLDELKASILAHGVVQSLRVRLINDTHYEVVAGNRRFLALQQLADAGQIDWTYEVPVIVGVMDDATAHELSVVENVERVPVSPIDEFKAFGRLIDEGKTPDDIALRFGVPVRRVQQRMKLAGLHPDLIDALDAGQLTLDAAQAFTIVSPDQQAVKFHEWMDGGQIYNLRHGENVRSALVKEHTRADSDLAKMIGEEAYLAAGGVVTADLFQDQQYWVSGDVIARLVDAAWADRTAAWLAQGWAWVKPQGEVPDVYYRTRVYPQRLELSAEDAARLAAIAEEQEEFDTDNGLEDEDSPRWNALEAEADAINAKTDFYSAEDMAKAGVVYWPTGRFELGVGEPRAGNSSGSAPAEKKVLPPEDPAAVGPTVSETLSAVLSDAIRTEVGADPDLALPLLAAFMAVGQGGGSLPAHISISSVTNPTRDGKQTIGETFAYFNDMPDEELLAAIAHMFANTLDVRDSFLDPALRYSSNTATGRQKLVADLVDIVVPRDFPKFDAPAYFAGVKKPLIAAAFKEITGEAIKDGKKGDMVATTAKLAVEHGWLPIALRSKAYEGPGAAVAGDAEQLEAAE